MGTIFGRQSDSAAGKTVLVTGCSTGIGESTALWLDKQGFTVFAAVRREADATSLKLRASDRLKPVIMDVTIPSQIDDAFKLISEFVGDRGLWGIVNNAGISLPGIAELMPMPRLREVMEVNFFGLVYTTQKFLPLVLTAKGRVVNITSVQGFLGLIGSSGYVSSKFAVEGWTDSLRRELYWTGVKVVLIEPGYILTPIAMKKNRLSDEVLQNARPDAKARDDAVWALSERRKTSSVQRKWSKPKVIAQLIEVALTSKSPKIRYRGGYMSTLGFLAWFLPAWVVDWVLAQSIRGSQKMRIQTGKAD